MTGRSKQVAGYLTVFLSLTLGVLLMLTLALVEGVRLSTLHLEAMCVSDIASDSVMAEYHRELFDRFNILAVDSSYGTNMVGRSNVEKRLMTYLERNLTMKAGDYLGQASGLFFRDFLQLRPAEVKLRQVSILSDGEGSVFRRLASEAVKDDLGLNALSEAAGWLKTVEEYKLDTWDVEAEKQEADEAIAEYQGMTVENENSGTQVLDFDNPTVTLEERKKTGIIRQVLGDRELSGRTLSLSAVLSGRKQAGDDQKGDLPVKELTALQKGEEKLLFTEYLMRYFGCFTEPAERSALEYELEYILTGKAADADNLKAVLLKLLAFREAANATYLLADEKKSKEAELAAGAASAVLFVPELKELFQTSIVLGWAYAESVYDLKMLAAGKRVPLIKTEDSWHYGLKGLLEDLWEEILGKAGAEEGSEGLSYQDHLRLLLLVADTDQTTLRAMDMVEADIRQTAGNHAFRLDGCYAELHTGIVFQSGFGYRLEIREEKRY